MATFKQHTVSNEDYSGMDGTESFFGKRNKAVLEAAFSTTSMPTEADITAQGLDIFQGNTAAGPHVVGGVVKGASLYWGQIDVEGAKKDIDINYNNVPDVGGNTKTTDAAGTEIAFGGGGGAPETPYIPPLTSPGAGFYTHSTAVLTEDVLTELAARAYSAFGSGDGHANPFAQTINTQTLGSYVKGDS